ncbi:hypothetical protein Tco_0150110 [Tanacetum coccineum]
MLIDNESESEDHLVGTRVRAHEFYQEMIRTGFVFEERPNEAINVPIEDEKSPSSEPRGSPVILSNLDSIVVSLSRFDTSARNPVKEILLKLNLPDQRILKDEGKGT